MDLAECRALMGHAEWAESLVWQAVLALPQEDAELQAKLYHLHMVQWAYLHIWRGEAVKPRELGTFATRQALCGWAREYYRDLPSYLAGLSGPNLGREVLFPWADRLVQRFGKARPTTWTESLLQVAMHSGYHRGQVARRLRELGVEPPLTDFIAWIWLDRPAADWGDDEAA
jgi:uncharacterized damage-inducible protein DinB